MFNKAVFLYDDFERRLWVESSPEANLYAVEINQK